MANLAPGQHRRRRTACAQPRAGRRRSRQGRGADHLAGAEPAGRRRQHIALFVTGRVPIRRAGDGAAPVPGRRLARLDRLGVRRSAAALRRPARAAAWSTPTTASRRPTSRCSSAATGSATGAPAASASCSTAPTASPRPTSPACRSTCSPRFARQILPALLACPPTDDTARRRQALLHDWDGAMTIGRAAAADLQRLDAVLLRRGAGEGRRRTGDGGAAAGVRRLRAVAGRSALVRRRLHAAAAVVACRCHPRPRRPLRHRPGAMALGHGASGGLRPPAAARDLRSSAAWARSASPAPATTPRSIAAVRSTNSFNPCMARSTAGSMTSPTSTAACS